MSPLALLPDLSMINFNWTDVVAATILIFTIVKYVHGSRNVHKLPPGPSGIPIFGNAFQRPSNHAATYFRQLVKEYGKFVSLKILGTRVFLIADMELAKKVLQKNSTKHSSRPRTYYLHKHVDPMNELWIVGGTKASNHTTGRKITTGIMNTVREGKTESLHRFETLFNIQLLLDDGGEHWYHNMQRASASTFFTPAFGIHFPTGNEPELKSFFEVLAEGLQLAPPSASIINVFPFLDLMPGPMPWRVRAKSFRQREDALYEKLFDRCLTGEASGMNTWAAIFASEDKAEGDQRRLMRELAGAAIESTASTLQAFVLACIRYPEWVATAQKELDTVVGSERLPTFKDRPSLPYMEAVLRETLRWRPIVRFGVPHKSTADDVVEYNGKEYFIPKGSTVYALTWAMEHDESQYEDHDRFMPERFFDSEGKLKGNYQTSAFGFGRRVCLGIPFAQRSLWIQFATMLWTFNILPSKQCDPKTGLPFVYDDSDAAFGGGLVSAPLNFPAIFEPRSLKRGEVARREWAECEKDLNALLSAPKGN